MMPLGPASLLVPSMYHEHTTRGSSTPPPISASSLTGASLSSLVNSHSGSATPTFMACPRWAGGGGAAWRVRQRPAVLAPPAAPHTPSAQPQSPSPSTPTQHSRPGPPRGQGQWPHLLAVGVAVLLVVCPRRLVRQRLVRLAHKLSKVGRSGGVRVLRRRGKVGWGVGCGRCGQSTVGAVGGVGVAARRHGPPLAGHCQSGRARSHAAMSGSRAHAISPHLVGVVSEGELAVGLLDLLVSGSPLHPQDLERVERLHVRQVRLRPPEQHEPHHP
jgi:hypothetical protein